MPPQGDLSSDVYVHVDACNLTPDGLAFRACYVATRQYCDSSILQVSVVCQRQSDFLSSSLWR
jgi:hypothetical protein